MTDEEKARELVNGLYTYEEIMDGMAKTLADRIVKVLVETRIEEREKVARWMLAHTLATGHGETIDDLLEEILWQVREKSLEEAAKIARGSLCSCCSPQDPERCIPEAEEIAIAIEKLRAKNES